jgi:hypothetical protein
MACNLFGWRPFAVSLTLVSGVLAGMTGDGRAQNAPPTVIAGSGNVTPIIDLYRKLLGDPNNAGAAGTQPGGRREINWDGVPDERAAPNMLPGDIFRNRGAILQAPGKGVQVSAKAKNPTNTRPNFAHINPTYEKIFKPFSGERMFSPVGSNVVNLTFVVPGTNTPAVVKGFGAVYIDTDRPHTSFQYFDRNGRSLGKFPVPAQDEGFTFLGVIFDQPIVARVRIEYGTTALGPNDDPRRRRDVSVMDDFIYGEPQAMK